MNLMTGCKYKKRIQFYLDGWIDKRSSRDLEKHLKHCADCQVELAELQELNSSAVEVIDQAPDNEYWESFETRVRNRIIARNVEPIERESRRPRFFALRLASIFAILLFILGAGLMILKTNTKIPNMLSLTAPEKLNNSIVNEEQRPANLISQQKNNNNPESNVGRTENGKIVSTNSSVGKEQNKNLVEAPTKVQIPNNNADNPTGTSQRDVSAMLRSSDGVAIGKAPTRLLTEFEPPLFNSSPDLASIDPSFRLKSSYIDQRIMADLNTRSRNIAGYVGALSGYTSAFEGITLNGAPADVSFGWGYLNVPADTSRAGDLKKYYIELELMQAK
jgi:hypothetical protein